MKRRAAWIFALIILLMAALPLPAPAASASAEDAESAEVWIVRLASPLPAMLMEEGEEDAPLAPLHEEQSIYIVKDPVLLEMLLEEGMLDWAEPDMEVELFAEGEEETDPTRWPLDMLGMDRGDSLGCCGQGVRVAVIDSGCNAHSELAHALLPGYNFINGTGDVTDNIGHGTFVSGLIAAEDDGIGTTGGAPDAKIVPLKCFDSGYSTKVSVLATAIYAAVDQYDCRVISMSFGLKSNSKTLETAVTYAVEKGAVCVASAGNYGNATLYYPAALPNVIGVGSVDRDGEVSSFSQRNESLTVTAPGREVYSTTASGSYTTKNGTSFSAPLISAMCARLISADGDIAPREVMRLLTASAKDLGAEGYDTDYGHGLADLNGAMELLLAENKVFLSPFRVKEGLAEISLFNNSAEALTGQCVLTRYSGGVMRDIFWEDVSLPPGESVKISLPDPLDRIKCFFWSDYENIEPVTPFRECEVLQ